MFTDLPTLDELKHVAKHEAASTEFNWDRLHSDDEIMEILETFSYAKKEVEYLERSYTRIANGDFPQGVPEYLKDEDVVATALISLAEELVSCYILFELEARFQAVKELTM